MASEDVSRRGTMLVTYNSEVGFSESTTGGKLLPKKEKPNGAVKLKKSIAKKAKDTESNGGSTSPNSPMINGASKKPPEDRPVCRHCKKSFDPAQLESHTVGCLEKKKETARLKKERKEVRAREAAERLRDQQQAGEKDKDGDIVIGSAGGPSASQDGGDADKAKSNGDISTGAKKPPRKTASKAQPGDKITNKKRKADGEDAEKEPKKKKAKKDDTEKQAPKPKVTKPRGPVNVETQCGVPLGEKGGFCARSLTCKSHSMGLKRAVPGRSAPYDQLLAMYQKKNQAKQQKALMDAQAGAHPQDEEDADGANLDSDEEREAVMKGLGRWRPRPLEQVITVGVGRRYKYVRLKEALGSALAGGGGRGLFGVPAPVPTTIGSTDGGFAIDGVEAAMEGQGRKASFASSVGAGHGHPLPKGVTVKKGSVASSTGGA
ncbi:uncharacterized protein KY384_003205 [Bacidia gigantensis]|uniref:uncharacterized protein n=1 Tax=Bacidia gigantensis TaxID=2732470 RepID=UPI001D054B95|nr:uncharacterized protein KY384_003205 [Bacidia gigantensis]KAG8531575.1 hypothetical protein KY384_003205 [Bacidia gigantensis]